MLHVRLYALLPIDRLIFLTAVHERERDQEALSNVLDYNAPDLSSIERESNVQAKRTVAERPAEISPQCAPEKDYMSRDAQDTTAQWEKSNGEWRYSEAPQPVLTSCSHGKKRK